MSPDLDLHRVTTDEEWEAARSIRQAVFIEGQNCPPEEEWDRYDFISRHAVGFVEGKPVATGRWRPYPYRGRRAAKLERIAVIEEYRGRGYGKSVVTFLMQEARDAGHRLFVLHAQIDRTSFYRSLGFEPVGKPFEEVNIPHIRMVRDPHADRAPDNFTAEPDQ